MVDFEILRDKAQKKIILKYKRKIPLGVNEDELCKNRGKEILRKSKKLKGKKEKEIKKKPVNNYYNEEKNEPSKESSDSYNFKNENLDANNFIKLKKSIEKKTTQKPIKSSKKKVYILILTKNFENFSKNKKDETNIECYGTLFKKMKISEEFASELEKIEISKITESSHFKSKINKNEKKFYIYENKRKNKEQKIDMNNNSKEEISLQKENKNIYQEKINKANKNKVFKNELNEDLKEKNNVYKNKKCNKLNRNYYINNLIENKNISNNTQRKYMNRNKYKKKYFIYFYLLFISKIFFSQFIKCNYRKIKLEYSYIDLKVKGTGNINILSSIFNRNSYPTTIIINNEIQNEIKNSYNFNEQENNINNITMIWNKSPENTFYMFSGCDKIIEIDLSNFDSSSIGHIL